MVHPIREEHFDIADTLWDHLSPTRHPLESQNELLYRGEADAEWQLLPSIMREGVTKMFEDLSGAPLEADKQAWMEFQMLQIFVDCCDASGVPVPNGAATLRDHHLRYVSFESYLENPVVWPKSELLETMAMARMHGLPTRLLDWSDSPYVAVYFAASEALRRRSQWKVDQRLAVWKLTTGPRKSLSPGQTLVYRAPGTISRNIVAQQGLFTILPIHGELGQFPEAHSFEYILPRLPGHTLERLTVPVTESNRLYHLCELVGFNSARMYPGADGARMAVMDRFWYTHALRSNGDT